MLNHNGFCASRDRPLKKPERRANS